MNVGGVPSPRSSNSETQSRGVRAPHLQIPWFQNFADPNKVEPSKRLYDVAQTYRLRTPRADGFHQCLHALNLGPGRDAVAKIEDVACGTTHGFEQSGRLAMHNIR